MAPRSKPGSRSKPEPIRKVEGGDVGRDKPAPAKSGGMIGEGAPDPGDKPRDGGMLGEG